MSLKDEVTALEDALKQAGVSIDAVLAEANVDRSTWTRWKNASVKDARYSTILAVKDAAARAIEARAAA